MSTTAEKLWETTQMLPEPMLAEVLNFAEYLRFKAAASMPATPTLRVSDMCGGLEDSATFGASSLTIQQQLRDEWS